LFGFDRRFGHSEQFEKSFIHIFLFRFCQQEMVGRVEFL